MAPPTIYRHTVDNDNIILCCNVQVQLPTYIENVKEKLAENLHELWAMSKIENGWIWGDVSFKFISYRPTRWQGDGMGRDGN